MSAARSTASSPCRGHEVAGEGREIDAALAVGRRHRQLLEDAEARDAGQRDEVAPVVGLGELR